MHDEAKPSLINQGIIHENWKKKLIDLRKK